MKNLSEKATRRKNILLVSPYPVGRGGIEIFLLNLVRSVPKEKYKFVWYCHSVGDESLAREYASEGVRIVKAARPQGGAGRLKRVLFEAKDFWALCKSEKFDIAHVHTANRSFQARYILLAWLYRIPCRIAHSHSYAPNDDPDLKNRLYRSIVVHFSNKMAACSSLAALHLYGSRYMDRAVIFPNGIDTARFAFSSEIRQSVRESMGLTNMLVFGHVGRFKEAKNHPFLIETFRVIAEKNNRARLLLLGSGKRIEEIKNLVRSYGLSDKVIFTDSTDRVSEYLCAADVFVLPSFYEGFPIANLEAQSSGLPCFVSDKIPPEAKIAEDLTFLPLEAEPAFWAEQLLAVRPNPDAERINAWQKVRNAGYDLCDMGRYAERLYG